jgi:hypothetical protein
MLATNFTKDAHAELAEQIATMTGNARKLHELGMAFKLAECLDRGITTGAIDLGALREFGVEQATAISICDEIRKRWLRRQAALELAAKMLAVPVAKKPAKAPEAPKPEAEPLDGMTGASKLHTLFEMAESGLPACLSTLIRDNWSESSAHEIVAAINAARKLNRKIKHV